MLVDELHAAIDAGQSADVLHDIVGLWEANNLNENMTFSAWVEAGKPTRCDDCQKDVMPYDGEGRPVENGWEWYMVRSEVWEAAARHGNLARFLCIGCLETRIGRSLVANDFAPLPLNEPGWAATKRLLDRLGAT